VSVRISAYTGYGSEMNPTSFGANGTPTA
jgi:hypothetical protein